MKKLYTLLAIVLCSGLSFAQAADGFAYTGALNANGWATHNGAIPGQIVTSPGSLSYPGLTVSGNQTSIVAGNTEDINVASQAPITGAAYYSALINVPNVTGQAANTTTGNYFLAFSATAGTSATAFNGRLYIRAGVAADTYNLGVLNGSGGTAAPTFSPIDYSINVTYFIVMKFDLTTNTASLFVNPAIGGTEGSPTVTNVTGTTAAPAQVAALAIRQGGTATAGTGNVMIDEVRLGATYAYVTSSFLGVKQNTIAGLNVYPNPITNGVLFITSDSNDAKSVVLFDVLGKQVMKTTVTDQPINVSNLNSGVYFLKITEDGKTATRKLVIK